MHNKRQLTLTFSVYTFWDEDYDEDDRPFAREVIDGMALESIGTQIPDYLVRQLGDYLLHSSSGQYTLSDELPKALTRYRPTKESADGEA